MTPVTGITWRAAAMYCNWLHNEKSNDLASLRTGAYDASTWDFLPGTGVTDAPTHLPGAKFWIPTVNEWLKAVHYDPNKNGSGGYWAFPNGSDTQPTYGLPGSAQSNAGQGWTLAWRLASYPEEQTPWGLFDASGMASEWLENYVFETSINKTRFIEGAGWSWAGDLVALDEIRYFQDSPPNSHLIDSGLRIAAAVPAPATFSLIVLASTFLRRRK